MSRNWRTWCAGSIGGDRPSDEDVRSALDESLPYGNPFAGRLETAPTQMLLVDGSIPPA